MSEYWKNRERSIYLYAVRELATSLAKDASCILDVGSAGCPYLDWFDWIPHRVSVDLRNPYNSENVVGIREDFLRWRSERAYDVVLCLQVLEHVEAAKDFSEKLLSIGNIVIISVPYRWKYGRNISHIHDPVDERKVESWFGRKPNYSCKITEVVSGSPRLISVYDRTGERWTCIRQRERLLKAQKKPEVEAAL